MNDCPHCGAPRKKETHRFTIDYKAATKSLLANSPSWLADEVVARRVVDAALGVGEDRT